jgi:hypothetical protein
MFDLVSTIFYHPHDDVMVRDDLAGDVGVSVWPPDPTSVTDFSADTPFAPEAAIHALTSLDADWQQPSLLFWEAAADDGHRRRWLRALAELGFRDGVDVDVWTVRDAGGRGLPSSSSGGHGAAPDGARAPGDRPRPAAYPLPPAAGG